MSVLCLIFLSRKLGVFWSSNIHMISDSISLKYFHVRNANSEKYLPIVLVLVIHSNSE